MAATSSPRSVGGRKKARQLSEDPGEQAGEAKELCLRLLTSRSRTRQQLADALAAAGARPEIAESVLTRLGEVGLIDDASYAAAFVRSRQRSAGLARSSLRRELRQRGVEDEVADEALSEIDSDSEREVAAALARQRAARLDGLAPPVRQRRLYAFLARRGYGPDVISAALASIDEEAEELGFVDNG